MQRGTYFGEDDIVRLEDDYGRSSSATPESRDSHRASFSLPARPTPSSSSRRRTTRSWPPSPAPSASCSRWSPRSSRSTYRGGAESRQRTFDLVSGMLHTTTLNPMAHLICVAHTRLELADILVSLRKAGVENLMALGGDPPEDPAGRPGRAGLRHRAGGAGPRHRRLLRRRGRPPCGSSALARPPERPRLPGRQAGPGRFRRHAVLLRGFGVRGSRRGSSRAGSRHAGPPGNPSGHLHLDDGPPWRHGRGSADVDGGAAAGRRRAGRRRRGAQGRCRVGDRALLRAPRRGRPGTALLHVQHVESRRGRSTPHSDSGRRAGRSGRTAPPHERDRPTHRSSRRDAHS